MYMFLCIVFTCSFCLRFSILLAHAVCDGYPMYSHVYGTRERLCMCVCLSFYHVVLVCFFVCGLLYLTHSNRRLRRSRLPPNKTECRLKGTCAAIFHGNPPKKKRKQKRKKNKSKTENHTKCTKCMNVNAYRVVRRSSESWRTNIELQSLYDRLNWGCYSSYIDL